MNCHFHPINKISTKPGLSLRKMWKILKNTLEEQNRLSRLLLRRHGTPPLMRTANIPLKPIIFVSASDCLFRNLV